jgi:hypothetical protein
MYYRNINSATGADIEVNSALEAAKRDEVSRFYSMDLPHRDYLVIDSWIDFGPRKDHACILRNLQGGTHETTFQTRRIFIISQENIPYPKRKAVHRP